MSEQEKQLPLNETLATLQSAINMTDGHVRTMLLHVYNSIGCSTLPASHYDACPVCDTPTRVQRAQAEAIEPPTGIPYVATLQFNYGTRQIRGTLTDAEIEAMCRPGPIVAVPAEAEPTADARDAVRWRAFCNLWAASTELKVAQEEDGSWSIFQVEDVEGECFGKLVGETPDDTIDKAVPQTDGPSKP